MCTINMTFDVPETRHINIEALKKQMHSYLEFILSMPSLDMTEQAEGKKYDMSVFDSLSNDWSIDASDIREARQSKIKTFDQLSPEIQALLTATAPLKDSVPEWDLNGDVAKTEALKDKYGY